MNVLTDIQQVLQRYEPEAKKSLWEKYSQQGDFLVSWFINNLCNFSCSYCGHYKTEHPSVGQYSIQHIFDSFDCFGKNGHIIITGGEPFLYPQFVELCKKLTEKYYISVNTNLSQPDVERFATEINPEKVIMINAGIHKHFRSNLSGGMDIFISNYRRLLNNGFQIIGSFVVEPDKITYLEEEINDLKMLGIEQISAKSFSGIFNGKEYPKAYTSEEIGQLKKYMDAQIDMPEYLIHTSFKGKRCEAGVNFFSIETDGNVVRCNSDNHSYGNIFKSTFKSDFQSRICRMNECICPYQGMLFSEEKIRKTFFNKFLI